MEKEHRAFNLSTPKPKKILAMNVCHQVFKNPFQNQARAEKKKVTVSQQSMKAHEGPQ